MDPIPRMHDDDDVPIVAVTAVDWANPIVHCKGVVATAVINAKSV